MRILNTQVLIIGGGVTGTGIARDLALRGVKCILAEYRDINAGASGGNHGLLHSGARYTVWFLHHGFFQVIIPRLGRGAADHHRLVKFFGRTWSGR